ncbi:MAG: hypothetical protein NWR72_13815, partial [Bacteroidia bacterium]|nr:hypothetical protein [Bacteroidia bacterium]
MMDVLRKNVRLDPRYSGPLVVILILGCCGQVYAQQPYHPQKANLPLESWRWTDFPQTEGKGVRYLHEYQDNKVWFATNDGLLHFDGYEYRCHTEEQGLIGAPAQVVFVTKGGVTIAGTDLGIFRYEEENVWRPVVMWEDPGSIVYFSVQEVSGQRVCLATNLGVIMLKPGEHPMVFTSQAKKERAQRLFPDARIVLFPQEAEAIGEVKNVSDVMEAEDGQIWFAVSLEEEDHGYLLRFNLGKIAGETLKNAQIFSSFPGSDFGFGGDQKMIQADDGKIWVINNSYRIGINIFDGDSWSSISLGEHFGGDEYATTICQTGNGHIWISSLGKLFRYDGIEWQIYQSPSYKVPGNKIMLFPAYDGSLWVMGVKSRVTYIDYSNEHWIAYPGLNYQGESEGGTWFLEQSGLAVFNKGSEWWAYGKQEGMIDAPVSIVPTKNGQVWVAGSHQGVAATSVLIGNRWETQLHPKLSWGVDYRAVFEDRDGALWFGASVDIDKEKGHLGGVLQLLNPQCSKLEWVHHTYFSQTNAYGIGQSSDGRIWVGGVRLYAYDGQHWQTAEQEYLQEYINEVFSKDGLLLVGTRHYGIYLYDGETWRHFDSDSGLTSNTIISLYADSENSIWAVTENDISRFDGQQWVNHVLPADMNMDFEGGELSRSADGACWINKSPREWKRRALSYSQFIPVNSRQFITYRYQPDTNPPETQILDHPDEIASEGDVMIAWNGYDYLGMTNRNQLSFSYRLDNGPWSQFSTDRRHLFTNLNGGTHTFEVKARDLDFNVDLTPAKTSFRVQVPIWAQPWFILLISVFVITLGIFEYRIVDKNRKLGRLNLTLRNANDQLQHKGARILEQNQYILDQQKEIILQKERLEFAHQNLTESHTRI